MQKFKLILITGISGAGRSSALKALEDIGYEAVDNIPLSFLPSLVNHSSKRPLAIAIDIRNRDFSVKNFLANLANLREQGNIDLKLLFLDCDDEILQRRFTETRRIHPIATDRPVIDGIRHERRLIAPLIEQADMVIDTSGFSGGDIKNWIKHNFPIDHQLALNIVISSFSYKKGLPREADLVFDVRFLKNPHYDLNLRESTGKDKAVQEFIGQDPFFEGFYNNLTALIIPIIPRYIEEGKSYLTIAIGCTGGKHRSVFVADKLYQQLDAIGYKCSIRHRDLV